MLIAAERLPEDYAATVNLWWRPLARAIAARREALGRGVLIGINGAQGTGKSTLCLFLELLLRAEHGLSAATISLDDLYLTKAERQRLAVEIHPLFATRGVPGTHDVGLGNAAISALMTGNAPVPIPRFDKSHDDRAPHAEWPVVTAPVDVVLIEGWFTGASPVDARSLAEPANALERNEDADAHWRTFSNTALAGPYAALFGRLDLLIMLAPPGFEQVREWRELQEQKLRERTGRGMNAADVSRFVDHYERLTRHMLATLPDEADIVVRIGPDHQPISLRKRDEPKHG
ncbi:kinase [Sphingomonas sp. AP4-R1]|nr:kinase [Sphingomonas sp. AP4-R1]